MTEWYEKSPDQSPGFLNRMESILWLFPRIKAQRSGFDSEARSDGRMKKPPAKGRGFCTDWSPRRAGVLGGSRTHGLSLRSMAYHVIHGSDVTSNIIPYAE